VIARAISTKLAFLLLTHVDELRMRLIVCAAALAVAFGFAFWQNHAVLNVLNRPLANATSRALAHSRGPLAQSARTPEALHLALNRQRAAFQLLAHTPNRQPPAERRA
jgi:sec-independent protein translocase protein TatC